MKVNHPLTKFDHSDCCSVYLSFEVHEKVILCILATPHTGTRDYKGNVIIGAGYKSESHWWAWYNSTATCVQKLTGIDNSFPLQLLLFSLIDIFCVILILGAVVFRKKIQFYF